MILKMENNENNVQDQEKKQSKGMSAGLVVIMLIVVLIIGIGGGYLLSKNDSLFNKNETKSNNNSSNTTQSNNNTSVENNTIEQNTVTNTTPTKSTSIQDVTTSSTNYDKYNMAIAEIKKCLKDGNWLKEKEITGSYEPYNEESTIKTYFARLDSINNKPYYVVRSDVFDASYLRLISYDYGENKVVVSSKCGADYGSVKIDINNNIVEVNATMYVAYYKIVDGKFEFLERADNSGDGVDEGRKKLEEKYRKSYNFVEINTQLTDQNIETYIK
jgi:flagellar basal body-associated protein FliL